MRTSKQEFEPIDANFVNPRKLRNAFALWRASRVRRIWALSCLFVVCFSAATASSAAADNISLAGPWRFALDRTDAGIGEKWFDRDFADKIDLPGVLQAQGYGDEISTNTPWVLSLYDKLWYLREDYTNYARPGEVKVPFLCQPPRHYLGAAWYQRDIEISTEWEGRRVVLFLERPHCESRVWLDDQLIGTNNSLCAPHELELGLISEAAAAPHQTLTPKRARADDQTDSFQILPGKHRLTVRVDNRVTNRGPDQHGVDAHSVSDSLGQSWNGIAGTMELRSTPQVWIEEVRVFGDLKAQVARVNVRLGNAGAFSLTNQLSLNFIPKMAAGGGRPVVLEVIATSRWTEVEATLPSGYPVKAWDEFDPQLFELTAMLRSPEARDSSVVQIKRIEFGFRDIQKQGAKLLINGHETFLRGTHDGGDFPLTGFPPTDLPYWRKTFQTIKDWGFNHVRFHSFCPPDAAFEAADELGLYLQIEPGLWSTFSPGSPIEKFLYQETEAILKAYGNHPSFVMFSPSNEPKGRWKDSLPKWAEHFRAEDPRRLYTSGTGFTDSDAPGPLDKVDYTATQRFGPARVRGEGGWFGRDYSHSLLGVTVPVVTHEVGQWCAYPDFSVIEKFTGYLRPGNYEIFRDSAEAHGVLEMNHVFAWASGRFQLACYKEEIEAAMRTPGIAGFQLLDLHDYMGQGTALVGILDPFWESKGYATPDEFKQFCNTVVPLARLTQRVFTTADKLEVAVDIANHSAAPMNNAQLSWAIRDVAGKIVAQNANAPKELPIGKVSGFGNIAVDISKLPSPGRYVLEVAVGPQPLKSQGAVPQSFQNSWNFWLYPERISTEAPKDVFVTSSWDDAKAKLSVGGKVLFLPRNADLDWTCPPLDTVPVFWNRLMNPAWGRMLGLWCDTNHPALAEFPTEPNCDWQWTQITRGVRPVNLARLARGLQPIVSAIDDWNRNWKLGAIFECRVGKGRLLVSAFDLSSDLEKRPVAAQLRRSLLDYMASEKFQPKTEVTAAEFESVLLDTRVMRKLTAKASGEGNVNAAIDGDPNTAWVAGGTGRGASGTKHPHTLTISFPQPVAMNGIVIMPRQNDRDHLGDIREFKVETSDDGQQWHEAAKGELASTWDPQRIIFWQTLSARRLRFTAVSGFGRDSSAAIADLAVMYAGPKLTDGGLGNVEYRRSRSTSTDVDEGGDAPTKRGTNAIPRSR